MSEPKRYGVNDCADFAAQAAMLELESEAAFEASAAGHEEEPVFLRALHVLRDLVERRLREVSGADR